MTIKHSDHAKDFAAATRRSLAKRGIAIVGITFVPGPGGDFTAGHREYLLDNNGTQQIRSHAEIREMAA